ncbi:ATP-binding protein [Mucisphaera sp.]|uniref:hybrid sensor histidine kinase/response regulator n=1 Tax=Mucisphaera sp. TaxID=2913024 RepID=UPI003D1490C3
MHEPYLLALSDWTLLGPAAVVGGLLIGLSLALGVKRWLAHKHPDRDNEQTDLLIEATRAASIGSWSWMIEKDLMHWDAACCEQLGVHPDLAYTRADFLACIHASDRQRVAEALEASVDHGHPIDLVYRVDLADGRKRYLSCQARLEQDSRGNPRRLLGVVSDVSAKHQAELNLRESQKLLDQVGKLARIGGWRLELNPIKPVWSPIVREIHDVPDDYVPDLRTAIDFYAPEARPVIERCVDRAIRLGEGFDVELRMMTGKGESIWVRSIGMPQMVDGVCDHVIGVFQDITQQVLHRQELAKARDQAQFASRSKSQFLANMSHEIRTPMTAILGYADLLDKPSSEGTQLREQAVATIRKHGEHLMTLIDDILDLSRVEAKKLRLETQDVHLPKLLYEATQMMAIQAEAKGLELHVDLSERVPHRIHTDPTRLKQVLVNLLGNAIKFTERGSILLRVDKDDATVKQPEQLVLQITDQGIGMTDDEQARVFDAFTQVDFSSSRRAAGTGLGLTICREFVTLLGGVIEVDSEPGRGSRFTVRLPIHPLQTQDPPVAGTCSAAGPNARQTLSGTRVLLAEDCLDNQRLLQHHLENAGMKVEVANDGGQALRAFEGSNHSPFDLILLDMQMPGVDGYEVAERLRGDGFRLPIVALTAHAMSDDRDKCLQAGCTAYATKPITRDELLAICSEVLAEASKQRAA